MKNKKLIVYGEIEFLQKDGGEIAIVHQVTSTVLLESLYIEEGAPRLGANNSEDWIVPHQYKGQIIWK